MGVMQNRTIEAPASCTLHDAGGPNTRGERDARAAPNVHPFRDMDPNDPTRREDPEDRALRVGEAVVWMMACASVIAHLYAVWKTRSIFGSVDTLAALLVAVLLLALVRGRPRNSPDA